MATETENATLRQPIKGVVLSLVFVAVGAIIYYVGSADLWWLPEVEPIWYAMLPLPLVMVFNWIFIFMLYGQNWPFQKFSQPIQGMLASIAALVLGAITYYIINHMAHWGAYIFPIGVAWLFWQFALGPWSGNPIGNAHQFKQPITMISGFIVTLGFALISFWIIPPEVLGKFTGIPFVWFVVAVIIVFTWQMWPIQVANPIVLLPGYLAFFSFILLWLLSTAGLDFFATPGSAEYGRSGAYMLVLLLCFLVPNISFQFWPIHRLSPWWRGFIVTIFAIVASILIYWLLFSISDGAYSFLAKTMTWGFCIFIAMFLYYGLFGGAAAPPIPGTAGTSEQT